MSNEHEHEHSHGQGHKHEHKHESCCGHEHSHNNEEHSHTHDHEHEHAHEHNHSHDGEEHTHGHSHAHEHSHEHKHECEVAVDDNLAKEEKTLKILLHHWVDHNKSHEESFKEWIEKAKVMNKNEVSSYIEKAVEFMEKADEMLLEAQKHI